MDIKSKFVKVIIICGIIGISGTALLIDFSHGKEIAMIGITGLIGITKGD